MGSRGVLGSLPAGATSTYDVLAGGGNAVAAHKDPCPVRVAELGLFPSIQRRQLRPEGFHDPPGHTQSRPLPGFPKPTPRLPCAPALRGHPRACPRAGPCCGWGHPPRSLRLPEPWCVTSSDCEGSTAFPPEARGPGGPDAPDLAAVDSVRGSRQLCPLVPGDTVWAPSVLPHGALGLLSHHPQLHFGRKMESKVSEGGLNVTLTIRLLMHGKVRSPRPPSRVSSVSVQSRVCMCTCA